MISVFAPPTENNTAAYAAGVVSKIGSAALNLADSATLEALCRAIAHWEESHPVWNDIEVTVGMRLCQARWPAFRAARLLPAEPTTEST
jgi:hypothetical protein